MTGEKQDAPRGKQRGASRKEKQGDQHLQNSTSVPAGVNAHQLEAHRRLEALYARTEAAARDRAAQNGAQPRRDKEETKKELNELSADERLNSDNSFFLITNDMTETSAETTREPPDTLSDDAYQGLAGDIIRAVENETEADPAGILVQVLALFGALVGRATYFQVAGAVTTLTCSLTSWATRQVTKRHELGMRALRVQPHG